MQLALFETMNEGIRNSDNHYCLFYCTRSICNKMKSHEPRKKNKNEGETEMNICLTSVLLK